MSDTDATKRKPRGRLKVYGWYDFRSEAKPRTQTREIVAAHSIAEVVRITGVRTRSWLWNICETGNAEEIATATATPGVVYWRAGDNYHGKWTASVSE